MNQELEWISRAFGALSNPNRARMFQQLRNKELECDDGGQGCSFSDRCCNVGELASTLEITPATVSHHLKELSRAGLVMATRRGRFIYCSVNEQAVARLDAFLRTGAAEPSVVASGAEPRRMRS